MLQLIIENYPYTELERLIHKHLELWRDTVMSDVDSIGEIYGREAIINDWWNGQFPAYKVGSDMFKVVFRNDPDVKPTECRYILVEMVEWGYENYFKLMAAIVEAIENGARLVRAEKQGWYKLTLQWIKKPSATYAMSFGPKDAPYDMSLFPH